MELILNSVERRLWLYMGMIHSVSGMWTWCFSENGDLYYTCCPNEEELKQFFYIGGCMDYAMEEGRKLSHPFIMNDTLGLMWAGEYAQCKDERRLIVIGPVFYLDTSMREDEKAESSPANENEMYEDSKYGSGGPDDIIYVSDSVFTLSDYI